MSFNIASYIDHTLLKQTTTHAEVDRLCVEASMEGFVAVCIPPKYVYEAKRLLDGSRVKIATVIGFPLGYNITSVKQAEIERAMDHGADELDMVQDLCALKSGDWDFLEEEIKVCIKPIHEAGKVIKVILETGILTENEIIKCCELYRDLGVDFLKTSTGFADIGVSVHTVQLMRSHLPMNIGIKASGGIRSYEFAKELIDAGATRIGTSSSWQILKESRGEI